MRHLPYPALAWPLADQRQPICAGSLGRHRRLERRRPSAGLQGVSHQLQADLRAARPAADPDADAKAVAKALGSSLRDPCRAARAADIADGARAKAFFEAAFPAAADLAARRGSKASSPAITSRSSTARGPRPMSTPCRSIAVPPTCSSAATSRIRPACPTRARCSARSAAASSCPITIAPQIEDGAIAGRGLEICWLKSQTDLLFAQIQGSARIRLEDGSTIRINYDAHNGYPYTAVGRILIDRGIIPERPDVDAEDPGMDGAESRRRQRSAAAEPLLRVLPRGAAVRQGRSGRRAGRAADAGPLDRGRQGAACLRHAVLHRRRAADRIGAVEDAVPPADDRAGYGIGDHRARARRSLFWRRRRCRKGVRPAAATTCTLSCWCRRASIRSARGRKMPLPDAAAVGENRKAVSASRSAEGPEERSEPQLPAHAKASGPATNATAMPQLRPATAAAETVPLPEARPATAPSSRGASSPPAYRYHRGR